MLLAFPYPGLFSVAATRLLAGSDGIYACCVIRMMRLAGAAGWALNETGSSCHFAIKSTAREPRLSGIGMAAIRRNVVWFGRCVVGATTWGLPPHSCYSLWARPRLFATVATRPSESRTPEPDEPLLIA